MFFPKIYPPLQNLLYLGQWSGPLHGNTSGYCTASRRYCPSSIIMLTAFFLPNANLIFGSKVSRVWAGEAVRLCINLCCWLCSYVWGCCPCLWAFCVSWYQPSAAAPGLVYCAIFATSDQSVSPQWLNEWVGLLNMQWLSLIEWVNDGRPMWDDYVHFCRGLIHPMSIVNTTLNNRSVRNRVYRPHYVDTSKLQKLAGTLYSISDQFRVRPTSSPGPGPGPGQHSHRLDPGASSAARCDGFETSKGNWRKFINNHYWM